VTFDGSLPEAYIGPDVLDAYAGHLPSSYGVLSPAVSMTAGAGTGIVVADGVEVRPRTNDFEMHLVAALPDWTPSVGHWLAIRYNGANYYGIGITDSGQIFSSCVYGDELIWQVLSSETISAAANKVLVIDAKFTRESSSAAGAIIICVNGSQLGVPLVIPARATVDIVGTGDVTILGISSDQYAGIVSEFTLLNFAPTDSEILDWYTNGLPAAWQYGSQVAQTSGTLTVGKLYKIDTFVSGDDFTNVGAASNANGVQFTATGTTPTTWTNGSSLRKLGATVHLPPEGIATGSGLTWEGSANSVDGTLPASGATKVTIRR